MKINYNIYMNNNKLEETHDDTPLHQKACIIRAISVFDLINNMIYGIYGYYLYILFAIASACGLYSAIMYDKSFLLLYLIYQCILLVFKSCSSIFLIILSTSHQTQELLNNSTNVIDFTTLDYDYIVPLSLCLVVIQCIIVYFVSNFYRSLRFEDNYMSLRM